LKIVFIDQRGKKSIVEARAELSLKDAAKNNDISGIIAECGGMCACATCHVYIDAQWRDKLPAPGNFELELLDAVDKKQPNSRLSCQILLKDAMDGMEVLIPESQY